MGPRDRVRQAILAAFRAGSRRRLGAVSAVLAAIGAMACAPPKAPAEETISLRLRGTPASASVVIDEEALGPLDFVAAHGVALPPGIHHVTVKAEGYFPTDRIVEARPGARRIELAVALVPIPD